MIKTTVFLRRVIWTSALCVLLSRYVGHCADWPQFNGQNRDNISRERGLLKKWPKGGPKLLWAQPGFGEGYSSVAVSDDTIYTAGKPEADMIIFALNLKGEVMWTSPNGPAWSGSLRGTRCTPTVVGGHVYVMSGNGRVACIRSKDGGEVWAVNVKDTYEGKHGPWGYSESLLIDGNKAICTPGGAKALVLALDKNTGREIWKTTGLNHSAGYVSPTAITHGARRIILAMSEKALLAVDATDGSLLWNVKLANAHGINAQTPLYHNGHVFTSSGWDTGSVLVKLLNDGSAITEAWRNVQFDNDFGGVFFLNECFYGFNWISNKNGQLMCVDFGTGDTRYAKFTSDQKRKGAITWADGMLYGYDEAGDVWLINVAPDGFEVISQFKLPEGSGEHWAHPVVSGGRLYVRHGDVLHAYDVKKKSAVED